MKRTPLTRKTRLRSSSKLKARAPMRRRRKYRSRTEYEHWVATQPCVAPTPEPCRVSSECHHPRIDTVGTSLRGPAETAIPLCRAHHTADLHGLSGPFKGWTGAKLKAWERGQIEVHRARYAAESTTILRLSTNIAERR